MKNQENQATKTWRVVVAITTDGSWSNQDVINALENELNYIPENDPKELTFDVTIEDMEQTGGVIEGEQEEDESEIRDNDQPKPRRDA